jgi:4-hydroxy-tetrahydrodipicolinate synthase
MAEGILVAVTDHAAERYRQRVGSRVGALDVRPEVAGRVAEAWAAGRVEQDGADVLVRDRRIVYVCRREPRSPQLVVVTLWEEGDGVRVPRRFTDALRRGAARRARGRAGRRGILGSVIGGVISAMATPFDAEGRVSEDEAVALMHHLLAHGSNGLVLAGTTGEGATLSDAEKLRLWELGVAECGDALVVAATGTYDTAHSVHLTERATELGVDALLVVTPYYNKPNRRGIRAHFEAVAGATDLPVIVYNIPSRCVVDIPNDLLRELAEVPNIVAVKQARTEDLAPIEGLDLLAGNDDMLADVLELGGTGGILVASHLVGEEMRRMIDEPGERRAVERAIAPVVAALAVTTNPIPLKGALEMLGHRVGAPRLPLVPLDDEERAAVRAALERYGLLQVTTR